MLLKDEKVDTNLEDANGQTALTMASMNGHAEVVAELLRHDMVHINHQSRNGNTALKLAAFNGHVDTVCELLKSEEVDPNLESLDGQTALTVASSNGHTEVVARVAEKRQSECESPKQKWRHRSIMCKRQRPYGNGFHIVEKRQG
jgi:ankyrin repeat protein